VAGWALPGLGHILAGQRKRGAILMITILGLFIAGLLIGGIDVIDNREDRWWFYAQALAGPITLVVDGVHQSLKPDAAQAVPIDQLPYARSIGRVNELGMLYCALAGLLNLLAIINVAYRVDPHAPTQADDAGPGGGRIVRREGA
jgi:hypothetical protein